MTRVGVLGGHRGVFVPTCVWHARSQGNACTSVACGFCDGTRGLRVSRGKGGSGMAGRGAQGLGMQLRAGTGDAGWVLAGRVGARGAGGVGPGLAGRSSHHAPRLRALSPSRHVGSSDLSASKGCRDCVCLEVMASGG